MLCVNSKDGAGFGNGVPGPGNAIRRYKFNIAKSFDARGNRVPDNPATHMHHGSREIPATSSRSSGRVQNALKQVAPIQFRCGLGSRARARNPGEG